ncbi:MAG: carbon-nitrogen hydrolase family protein [Candidatus Odinarchaeota archaeon]
MGGLFLNIVLHQLSPVFCEKKYNVKRIIEAVKRFETSSGVLHVFPELFLTGYNCKKAFFKLAEPIPGSLTHKISRELSDETYVLTGMAELEAENKKIYNTAVLLGRNVVLAKYRKICLPNFWVFKEKEVFTAGETPTVTTIKNVKIGVQICYDINFPELSRIQALKGSEIITVISATPKESIPRFKCLLKARAIENQCFIVYVNRVGVENDIVFGGNSMVISPAGEVKLLLNESEKSCSFSIDIGEVPAVRSKTPLIKDAIEASFRFFNK